MTERQAFGIDINEYSRTGGINYELVKACLDAGVYDFLIMKAGLGDKRCALLDEQRQNAEAKGIPYATYHFLDPRGDIQGQARKYVDWVGTGQPFYIIDIESPQKNVNPPNKAQVMSNIKELEKLTHQQPVLYSSKLILQSIGFLSEASQYRLWIAQYPYDATRPSQKEQYRYFHDFAKNYAYHLPSPVVGTNLAKNTILWQFSSKGDGPYYIYNTRTADPVYSTGMKGADLNVSTKSCSEFMMEMFGIAKNGGEVIIKREDIGVENPPEQPPYTGMTNQQMINLILKAAQPFTANPWQDWIVRAGLEYLAVPNANRKRRYTGPRIEDLPNLTEKEKQAILKAMG